MQLKLFLAGANGFIGKNLIEGLKDKYIINAPPHQGLDLSNFHHVSSYFKKNGPFDVVINCAVIGGRRNAPNTPDIALANLKIFFNLANLTNYYKKFIHFGSGAEFDKSKDIRLVKEKDFGKEMPPDPFGFSKFVIAKYIEDNNKFINLRLFGVYGRYERQNTGFVSSSICEMLQESPITINQNVYYDYIYVNDLVKIVDHFIKHDSKYRSYNVGVGKPIDLLSMANIIKDIHGGSTRIIIKKKGLSPEYTCDSKRLRSELKFKFKSHEKSLKDLYDRFWNNRDLIKL